MLVPKLLEICHKSVKNLPENSQLHNSVRYKSDMCHITVNNQSVAKMYQNCLRKNLEMDQKCIRISKCVRKQSFQHLENCQISVRNINSDTLLTHFYFSHETSPGNILDNNLSENYPMTHFWHISTAGVKHFPSQKLSDINQVGFSDSFLTHLYMA